MATTSRSLCSGDENGSYEATELFSSESSREWEEIDALLESSNLPGLRQVPLVAKGIARVLVHRDMERLRKRYQILEDIDFRLPKRRE